MITAILSNFIDRNSEYLEAAFGCIDGIVVVPSTDRPPPHPLELLLSRLELDVPVLKFLRRTDQPIGFRMPSADAYQAIRTAQRERILLVDDVYTTGSHLNSAAVAMRRAGSEIVGSLVLARRINPDYSAEARQLWELAKKTPFGWTSGPYITRDTGE